MRDPHAVLPSWEPWPLIDHLHDMHQRIDSVAGEFEQCAQSLVERVSVIGKGTAAHIRNERLRRLNR